MFLKRLMAEISNSGVTKHKMLTDLGINHNAFAKWNKPGCFPNGETLSKIASYFGVSTDYLLCRTDIRETSDRRAGMPVVSQLIAKKYAELDSHGKNTVNYVINSELARIRQLEQARAATRNKSREYNKITMRIYNESTAAGGFGDYLSDYDNYEVLSFDPADVPTKADYGLRVSGDSMEPTIKNGSIVWVETVVEVNSGEIGIFTVNGDSYCKELHIDYGRSGRRVRLVSHNEKYPPKKIVEGDDIRTYGRVLL